MRIASLTLLIFLFITGCIFNDSFNSDNVRVRFTLSDTSGVETSVFTPHENFKVTFKVTNNSGQTLTYQSGLPVIRYAIFQGDTRICTSTDFMSYVAVVISGKLKSGETMEDTWVGPNTKGRIDEGKEITLTPGTYRIKVYHPSLFKEYRLPDTPELSFKIVNE